MPDAGALLRFDGAVKHDAAVEAYLVEKDAALSAIARRWFYRIRTCGDDVLDLLHDGLAVACVEDAPFAYVGIFKAHVNVGFYRGAFLPDPARLLEGNGVSMRHVKLKPGDDVDAAALSALIDAAYVDIASCLLAR
jgi:hypothetical protein